MDFKSLFMKRKPSAPVTTPWGLSKGELNLLADLRNHEGFDTYLSLLDKLSILYGDALLVSNDNVTVHYYRGMIQAIKSAASLVDETLAKQEDLARTAPIADTRDARVHATYGTPFWKS